LRAGKSTMHSTFARVPRCGFVERDTDGQ
jgi:hypothetical protein